MASTKLWYLAIKKETTTASAVKPSHFLKFKDGDLEVNKTVIESNPIMNNRSNAICPVAGQVTTEWTYNFDLDAIESIYWLFWMLWSISTSDIWSTPGEVYQHTITLANSLPSFTLEQWKGNLTDTSNNLQNYQVDRWFWVMVDSITLSWNDELVNLEVNLKAHWVFQRSLLLANAIAGSNVNLSLESVEWLTTSDTVNIYDTTPQNEADAIASISTTNKTIQIATLGNTYTIANKAKVELTPQTPSYWACKPFSFVSCNFQFGADLTAAASATETNIEDWSITLENQLEERFGSLRASPSVIAPKWFNAKMSFTKYFENVQERDKYLAMEEQAVIVTITNNEVVWVNDTNNAKYTIKLECSRLVYTAAPMPTWTDDLYAVNVEGTFFYDADDWRVLRILATNNQAGTIYTA